jgi:hypothetical protein
MTKPANDKMTTIRKVKLMVKAILETAEEGGMAPGDCGTYYDATNQCFDNILALDGGEEGLVSLIEQVQEILSSDKSDPTWDEDC